MISPGRPAACKEDITISEAEIASRYLGIHSIPCTISSPFRKDCTPSFAIYSPNGTEVNYRDFSTGDRGTVFTLLRKLWGVDMGEVYKRICSDTCCGSPVSVRTSSEKRHNIMSESTLECRTRDWMPYDIEYWESYGVPLKWLKYANVFPISNKIVIKDGERYVFGADRYAYAFAEFKGGKTTLKIYQPFNKKGFKWANKHDESVISLWTKIPPSGEKIVICSSVKDALCLWANTGLPSIALQGEGYGISNTAVNELKKRFQKVYICFDNDKAGLEDAEKLASKTGFINIVLPNINNKKDISDIYKSLEDKSQFKSLMLKLFNS